MRTRDPARSPAHLVGATLAGAWRAEAKPLALPSAALDLIVPHLILSGAGGLAWRRAKATPHLNGSASAAALDDEARRLVLGNALSEASLDETVARLNLAGVTPLLFKGLAAARAYAGTWVRPCGDFDLMVRASELDAARRTLLAICDPSASEPHRGQFRRPSSGLAPWAVDLHASLDPLYATSIDAIFARARPIEGLSSRVLQPCPEDHLRLVILHFLKHGGCRPLWLCDVAALTEQAEPDFDWRSVLTADRRRAGWVQAVIAAAGELLDSRTPDVAGFEAPSPRWFVRAILKHWEDPDPARFTARRLALIRAPAEWFRSRWIGPIRSALVSGANADTPAPLAWQVNRFAKAAGKAMRRGPGLALEAVRRGSPRQ